jgi:hypothetical protein
VKSRPIIFSGPMVLALLAGTKTQTRRAVKVQPDSADGILADYALDGAGKRAGFALWYLSADERVAADWHVRNDPQLCPYGMPGDQLWVRESFIHEPADYVWEASVSSDLQARMTTYTLELQRPAGVLETRKHYHSHKWALRVMANMISSCRDNHGLVLVFRDGREITYAQMRGMEVLAR